MTENRKNDALILERLSEIKESVTILNTVIMGAGDVPGLAGTVKEHDTKIEKLMKLKYEIGGGLSVIAVTYFLLAKYVF